MERAPSGCWSVGDLGEQDWKIRRFTGPRTFTALHLGLPVRPSREWGCECSGGRCASGATASRWRDIPSGITGRWDGVGTLQESRWQELGCPGETHRLQDH